MGDRGPVRVLMLEDERGVAQGAMAFLAMAQHDIEVVRVELTVDRVVEVAPALRPDVILADIELLGEHALDLPSRLGEDGPPVLWWSGHGGRYRVAAVIAGGAGFVDKRDSLEALVQAVHRVASGRTTWDVADLRAARNAPARPTPRQLEVLRAMATGRTNKEVAAELGITERTVEKHLRDMYDKYDAGNRVELVKLAYGNVWLGALR